MLAQDASLFDVYRWLLTLTVCTYVVIRCVTAAWQWYAAGAGAARGEAVLRTYLVTVLLRVRARRFWFELFQIGVLCGVLVLVLYLHR